MKNLDLTPPKWRSYLFERRCTHGFRLLKVLNKQANIAHWNALPLGQVLRVQEVICDSTNIATSVLHQIAVALDFLHLFGQREGAKLRFNRSCLLRSGEIELLRYDLLESLHCAIRSGVATQHLQVASVCSLSLGNLALVDRNADRDEDCGDAAHRLDPSGPRVANVYWPNKRQERKRREHSDHRKACVGGNAAPVNVREVFQVIPLFASMRPQRALQARAEDA